MTKYKRLNLAVFNVLYTRLKRISNNYRYFLHGRDFVKGDFDRLIFKNSVLINKICLSWKNETNQNNSGQLYISMHLYKLIHKVLRKMLQNYSRTKHHPLSNDIKNNKYIKSNISMAVAYFQDIKKNGGINEWYQN